MVIYGIICDEFALHFYFTKSNNLHVLYVVIVIKYCS